MAVFVKHGSKRRKFRTLRGASWHVRRMGGTILKVNGGKKRKAKSRRRKSSSRRKPAKRRRASSRRRKSSRRRR